MLTEFYWWLRRTLTPRDWYYAVKAFIQRGRRGWSDRDAWSMYSHVGPMMADMLKTMREKSWSYACVHGEMGSDVRGEHMLDSSKCDPEDWNRLLHRIEFGLRYYDYVFDGDCDEHYGWGGWMARTDSAQAVIVMAFADLGEYWGALWD